MRPEIFIFKVGPDESGGSLYVPMGEDGGHATSLDPVHATDDLSGVRGIVAQRKDELLICSPELAATAQQVGLETRELPTLYQVWLRTSETERTGRAVYFEQGGKQYSVFAS